MAALLYNTAAGQAPLLMVERRRHICVGVRVLLLRPLSPLTAYGAGGEQGADDGGTGAGHRPDTDRRCGARKTRCAVHYVPHRRFSDLSVTERFDLRTWRTSAQWGLQAGQRPDLKGGPRMGDES